MRVISGTARRLPLKTIEGPDTRPTTDRIKETLFNMLQNDIPGCLFLDLFAGSGAIGIEALSRGAKEAYFVEKNSKPATCIKENLKFTKLSDKAVVMENDVMAALSTLRSKVNHFDIIFMDPPYQGGFEPSVLEYLSKASFVDEDTMIIVEADLAHDFSFVTDYGFTIEREKKYKTNKHVFLYLNR